MVKSNVLFLCTGNSCRSQMAEAWLRRLAGDRFEVFSAGTAPKPIHPFTCTVMAEVGVEMTGHTSKLVTDLVIPGDLDYLITVCDDADKNCPVGLVRARQRMHWSFEDPAVAGGSEAERLEKFREVRDLIRKRLQDWLTACKK
jgi:arsenate reductase (thioredoxin)